MRVFTSPEEYIQGPDAFKTQLHRLLRLGNRALIVSDSFVMQMLGTDFVHHLVEQKITSTTILVDNVISGELLIEAKEVIKNFNCQFVIALGGGKAMDLGKMIAHVSNLPIAVLPTSAASDAATSRISVVYDEKGNFQKYDFYEKNPAIVLVDTSVILNAPQTMLIAGFADGIATYIEARSVFEENGRNTRNEKPTLAALSLAKSCHDVLIDEIANACHAQRKGTITQSFENVVEANILLSGLGFENAGLSLAHGFHNVIMGEKELTITGSHGQIVAVGVLLQLLAEQRLAEYPFYHDLFANLLLPTTLKELNLKIEEINLQQFAEKILETKKAGNRISPQVNSKRIIMALKQLA